MSKREKMSWSIQTMVPCKTKLAGVMPLWRACCRLNCPESLKFNQFQLVILGILGEFFFFIFVCDIVWIFPVYSFEIGCQKKLDSQDGGQGELLRGKIKYIYFANIPMTLSLQIPNCNLKHWWNFKGFKS